MLNLFVQGFAVILQPECLLLIVAGTAVGILFGAVPGLTSVMAVALFLPVTYSMDPGTGIAVLVSLYIGSVSGGLISAILLKIPGTPSSVATCWDGHPMVARGEGAKALGVGVVFSFLGTVISIAALVFTAPPLARIALQFGPHEYFSIAVFSLTLIAGLSSGSMVKGLFSGAAGFAFATVGIAPIEANVRFAFGSYELAAGFKTLTVLIGLFAVSEILKSAETARVEAKATVAQVGKIKGFGFSWTEFKSQAFNLVRSSVIGVGVGILPGIGSGTSNIISYLAARKQSKHPEKFGTGVIDGIVAPETANNAGIGGAMIPLMTLGIPGDGVTAILLGGFMVHGIAPGPLLFTNHAGLVYTIFAALTLSSVVMVLLEFFGMRVFIKLLRVPKHILLPIVFILCVVGAFGLSSLTFDV
ncbi:MAG: tripartite tricarboxylate transporter permease, partial [Planctomycetota bacterium]|nr:tripartite tricarboxylate transporter permease [Planctomycetota bacterium]